MNPVNGWLPLDVQVSSTTSAVTSHAQTKHTASSASTRAERPPDIRAYTVQSYIDHERARRLTSRSRALPWTDRTMFMMNR